MSNATLYAAALLMLASCAVSRPTPTLIASEATPTRADTTGMVAIHLLINDGEMRVEPPAPRPAPPPLPKAPKRLKRSPYPSGGWAKAPEKVTQHHGHNIPLLRPVVPKLRLSTE